MTSGKPSPLSMKDMKESTEFDQFLAHEIMLMKQVAPLDFGALKQSIVEEINPEMHKGYEA